MKWINFFNRCTSGLLILCFTQSIFAVSIDANNVKSESISPTQILYYINVYRAKRHLPPLKMNTLISAEALKHSQNMAHKAIPFGHQYFGARIKHVYKQIKNCKAGAENVAYYKTNAKKLVDAWISSPGHRRNIEGHFNLTGIGIAYGKKGWAYYTQIFVSSDEKKSA